MTIQGNKGRADSVIALAWPFQTNVYPFDAGVYQDVFILLQDLTAF
jgi:hypothetical protein